MDLSQQTCSELSAAIEAITGQINRLLDARPARRPEDVDCYQLAEAWRLGLASTRKRMKLCGAYSDQTGFNCILVYDPNKRKNVLVIRRANAPASAR